MTKKLTTLSILLISLVAIVAFGFSKLTPSASPSSTFHSLNDIYTLITNNTLKGTPNSAITTSSSPTATTSHSIGEIYTILANIKVNKATSTYSSLAPTTAPGGTGYTLEDIWNLINNSTYAAEGNHDITKGTAPSATMHTTSDIYNYLNTTFRDNLQESKIRNLGYILGKTGTFVIANLGEYCEANDECSTGWCGDDSWGCWNSCNRECTTGGVGSYCTDKGQCATGFCDTAVNYSCTDGSIGSGCGSNADCATGLYCGDIYWNFGAPTCTDGSVGQYCGPDSCAPGNYCDPNEAMCAATDGNLGSGCRRQLDCDAGLYCSEVSYVCTSGGVGESCDGNSQCSTGYCDFGTNSCAETDREIGSGCNSNSGCVSNYCDPYAYICTNGSVGSGCNNINQCSTGYCDQYNHVCSLGGLGDGCSSVSGQCSTGYCDTLVNHECTDGSNGSYCNNNAGCSGGYCSIVAPKICMDIPNDPYNNLTWSTTTNSTWNAASTSCANLAPAGTWRMATADELYVALNKWASDYGTAVPNRNNFVQGHNYWAVEEVASNTANGYDIKRQYGTTWVYIDQPKTRTWQLKCVK